MCGQFYISNDILKATRNYAPISHFEQEQLHFGTIYPARKRLSFVGKRIISPPRSCVLESNIKVLKKRSSTREARLSYPSGCSVLILSIAASRSRCALFMNGQRIKRRSSLRVRIIPYSLSRAFVKTISLSS